MMIPFGWLKLFPDAGWNVSFWISVKAEADKQGVSDPDSVKQICRKIWSEKNHGNTTTAR
jgi:hypothetical protein